MGLEIERKYLLKSDEWRDAVHEALDIRQGYLATTDKASMRIRIQDKDANINIKAAKQGASRAEYEYSIPMDEAERLLETLCEQPLIEKTRHLIKHESGLMWEIDEFWGDNAGLVVAEIELESEDQQIALPDWVGAEVTDYLRYYNNQLRRYPYTQWTESEKLKA